MVMVNTTYLDREVIIDRVESIIEEFRVKLSMELYELASIIDRSDLNNATENREATQTIGDTYRYLRKKYATFGSRYGEWYGNSFVPREIYMLSFVDVIERLEKSDKINKEEAVELLLGEK